MSFLKNLTNSAKELQVILKLKDYEEIYKLNIHKEREGSTEAKKFT